MHVTIFLLITPNLQSGLPTPIDVDEAQLIYIYIFKIVICKPKLNVHLCWGWVHGEKVQEKEQLIIKKKKTIRKSRLDLFFNALFSPLKKCA